LICRLLTRARRWIEDIKNHDGKWEDLAMRGSGVGEPLKTVVIERAREARS